MPRVHTPSKEDRLPALRLAQLATGGLAGARITGTASHVFPLRAVASDAEAGEAWGAARKGACGVRPGYDDDSANCPPPPACPTGCPALHASAARGRPPFC